MSYNISAFNIKKIEDLKIPLLDAIRTLKDVSIKLTGENITISAELVKSFDCSGHLDNNNIITITEIDFGGEGSGNSWELLIKMLKKTTGKLSAIVVWEGGDSLGKLSVVNGVITETEVDL